MARKASGSQVVEQEKAGAEKAKTVEDLRQAQAVLPPFEFGLSLKPPQYLGNDAASSP